MSKTPQFDQKVQEILSSTKPGQRVCPISGQTWELTERELEWCRTFNVPPSDLSPRTRFLSIGAFTIGYEWWWNQHAKTGKPILTFVHPATDIKVLPDAEWQNEDYRSEGRELDASQSLFDQMLPLRHAVPMSAFFNQKEPQNSYALISQGDVNSYFVIACQSKNSFYSSDLINGESSAECYLSLNIAECYRLVHTARMHRCRYALESYDCRESAFLFDCRDCEYCFGAWNRRKKKYLWMNEQLSQTEWEKRRAEVDLSRRDVAEGLWEQFKKDIQSNARWPENFNQQSGNCVGEYLTKCTNCMECFVCVDGPVGNEHCYYLYFRSEGNFNVGGSFNVNRSYFSGLLQETTSCKFSAGLIRCQNLEYSLHCQNCENCFGCVGLNRQKFCILNKQYDENEYWKKVDEIKSAMLERGEYGKFFSGALCESPFLATVTDESMLATEKDRDALGFPNFDFDSAGAIGELGDAKDLTNSQLVPNAAAELTDDWAGKPLLDKLTGRKFAYLKPEIAFYKQHGIAPPTKHHIRRVKELYWLANAFELETKVCEQCRKEIRVAKNKTMTDRRHLCRECYLKFLETHG